MECFYCHKYNPSTYYKDREGRICCQSHMDDTVAYCSECFRLVKKAENTLSDGRVICPDCIRIAVSPKQPFNWIVDQVLARMKSYGFGALDMTRITIWSATTKEMAMYRKAAINVFNEGFCRLKKDGKIDLLIESHLTKIHFAGVLSHELMHAWCFQNGFYSIPQEWSEGICNLCSYLTYQSIDFPLAKVYQDNMMEDPDPIYGDGFRMVLEFYKRYGWGGIMKKIKEF